MSKVLVTGGLGYIGSHTVVDLKQKGYDPIIVDDLSNSKIDVLKGLKSILDQEVDFEINDISDKEVVKELFDRYEISSVIHFAASKSVVESVKNPLHYYRNNLNSLINLLEIGELHGLKSLIFSSSCTVYGNPEKLPVTEETPWQPAESPYGNTKQVGEEIIKDYCKANPDFRAIALRYFNPIGAHKSALIGEYPFGVPVFLMPYLLQVAIGIREKLFVFGDDYTTSDGTAMRDYIHIMDLADAHIKSMEYTDNMGQSFDTFNIGTGMGSTVLEVINAFEKYNGIPIKHEIVDRRPGDVEKIYADVSKANKLLGWEAKYELKEMVITAWEWQKKLGKPA